MRQQQAGVREATVPQRHGQSCSPPRGLAGGRPTVLSLRSEGEIAKIRKAFGNGTAIAPMRELICNPFQKFLSLTNFWNGEVAMFWKEPFPALTATAVELYLPLDRIILCLCNMSTMTRNKARGSEEKQERDSSPHSVFEPRS